MNIYVLESAGGMCKIGRARDPINRLAALKTGHPHALTVAHTFVVPAEKAADIERLCHEALASCRMAGEWFAISAADAASAVEKVISGRTPRLAPPSLSREQIADLSAAHAHLAAAQAEIMDMIVAGVVDDADVADFRGRANQIIAAVERARRFADDDL